MKLILASASPRRAEILRGAGIAFAVLSSAVDETPFPGESPHDIVQRLASAKAELVAARAIGPAIVIAADTVVALEGQIIGGIAHNSNILLSSFLLEASRQQPVVLQISNCR